MCLGNVDRIDVNSCSGWVLGEDDAPVRVDLIVNGRLVYSEIADLERVDVEALHGVRHCGFSFGMAPYLAGRKNIVEIRAGSCRFPHSGEGYVLDPRQADDFVERGLDGWLFLRNDANDVSEIVKGTRPLSKEDLAFICGRIETQERQLAELACEFVTYVIPEKSVILHAKRLDQHVSARRPACQLVKWVRSHRIGKFIYNPEVFGKDPETFFNKGDTHPHGKGLFAIFRDMAAHVAGLDVPVITFETIDDFVGDLSGKLIPPPSEISYRVQADSPGEFLVDTVTPTIENSGRLRGKRIHYLDPARDGPRILIFGTSSAYYMRDLFFQSSREVHLVWQPYIDMNIVKDVRPDIVMNIITERLISRSAFI